ncbi:MAG: prepilin-type N-terminal cleavage/methylation domain-containing protein [Planctomycetota bacterium]|nr:prepilin-type N-terminal cleavage/methylation domain-containing protein [Planctomycetota bacterium]
MKIRTQRNAGFTLIELMIVVAIIAIVAAVAIPKLMSARISANENAAVATLRSIAAAQQQFQSSCAIDTDADGGGEFGFFGELSGTDAMRIYAVSTGLPALGTAPDDQLDPPFLATAFGNVVPDGSTEGVVERQGYYFKIYLPGPTAGAITPGLAEAGGGGAESGDMGAAWGSSNSEILWCAYAWPVDTEKTGNRCFFINQEGDLVQFDNRDVTYEGTANVPTFGAAYSNATANSMEEDLGLSVMGFTANDGNVWTAVGN